jgi:5-(carboxyamino)imidazole ribonucleotide synthase
LGAEIAVRNINYICQKKKYMKSAFDHKFKLGVLGGGQLGRMLVQEAINYNLQVAILDGDPDAPCKNLVEEFYVGKLTDYDAVMEFGRKCDVVTIEIENVNTDALADLVKEGVKVYPQPEIIALIKNKVEQKLFYRANNIPTANFIVINDKEDIKNHLNGLPWVNKLATEGYDGRGVQMLRSKADLEKAFDAPGLLEQLIPFEKELSVIVARNEHGEVSTFPTVELVFHPEHNLVEYLFAPADISDEVELRAQAVAKDVIDKLGMVGLLAVELFLTKEGEILVNEVAPRTHNSGHQTIEGNITSQFDQHLRAILDWPLGDTTALSPSAMVNVLGEDGFAGPAIYEGAADIMRVSGVSIHLYGKKLTKPFRKMGHVTILDSDVESLKEKANFVKQTLKVKA